MIHDRLTNEISVAPDLWTTSILPEGILERWIFADGSPIEAGDAIAMVCVESALHEILAPAKGRLHIRCKANCIVEPGSVIGHISRDI